MENIWQQLEKEIHKEPTILPKRITANNLHTLYKEGRAVIQKENGSIVGFVALWDTSHGEWFEIGSLWVHPNWRGDRIASKLFEACIGLCIENTKLLITSENPRVIHLAKKAGFKETLCTQYYEDTTCKRCEHFLEEEKHLCPFLSKKHKRTLFLS